ncbi:hypothetical protein KJ951_02345 [Patescibacteria group bacterium]|nr:hypothetical protein [Patescibacteria group bacterium]MBU1703221.1 hypothetical protein [Patescibacteria group bacterium]MBU1953748.1 hypothetical protein [Patescibacteria group bacterium]
MNKTCETCGENFILSDLEIRQYKKNDVTPLPICFPCQHKHRLSFRNERTLYTRKCDGTGESIITIYAPDSPYKVYKNEYWYSDKWDPMEYGMDFDFNRPFFDQLRELNRKVPRVALINLKHENSDYCNMAVGNKNCYLVFGGDYDEDCMYMTLSFFCRDCLDADYSNKNELTYMADNTMDCYDCQYIWDSRNCTNCYFSTDLSGCTECIFCNNLQNKSYCIENKQYTKEEYLRKKAEILDGSYATQRKNWEKFRHLRESRIVKYAHIMASENCTGDYIKNSKNCTSCFDCSNSEDVSESVFLEGAKDGFNISFLGHKSELTYNCISVITSSNIFGSYFISDSSDIFYSEMCLNSQDLFGCQGLRRKKYCILNKQYTKEEYQKMVPKIIEHMKKTGEWGRFLPKDFSAFAYNEGTGMRYFPLTKEQALQQGFRWRDEDAKSFTPQTYVTPDNIKDVPDSITSEVLACTDCKKNFKILQAELQFYRKLNIPAPRTCADCRQKARNTLRNPYVLHLRTCKKCAAPIQTAYAPGRPETVYCEKCYLKEVY